MRVVLVMGCLLALLAACGGEERAAAPAQEALPLLVAAADTGAIELHDGSATRTICEGFSALRAPAMHHDGERFCFLAKATARAPWRLYTASIAEGAPVAIDTPVDAESAPAWLPDSRIVLSAATVDSSRALFVIDPASATAERITFSGTDARDPCVLKDGRILYAGTRTTPEGHRAPGLFTVHPDGTGVLLFHGVTRGDVYERPLQLPGGDVVFDVRSAGRAITWQADWRAPHGPATEVVVSHMRPGELDLRRVRPRPRPQGQVSMLDPNAESGSLLCVDARRGVEEPAAFVRFHARVLQPDAGAYDWMQLGRVPLEADGSFFASVPADTPLRVDVLASDGTLVRTSRTPFWVRPGEIRGCTGCHEDPDVTPPNRQPAAALEAPVVPERTEGGVR